MLYRAVSILNNTSTTCGNTVNVNFSTFLLRGLKALHWLFFLFFATQKFLCVPELVRLISTCFVLFQSSLCFFAVKAGVVFFPAAPQGSAPPHHRCSSSGSLHESEQWKVMGHKLLIRAFLGLIVGFVSAPSVSVLPHSRGSNEALCDMMSPLRTANHLKKGPGSSKESRS